MKTNQLVVVFIVLVGVLGGGFWLYQQFTTSEEPVHTASSGSAMSTGDTSDTSPDLMSGPVNWYPYNEGISLSESKSKKVFLTFYADWCHYCREMDKITFKDAAVVQYLNDHFIPIRVNSEKQRGVAAQFQVRGLPSSWFIAENGERIGNRVGYLEPDYFLTILKYVDTNSYMQMNLSEFAQRNS